MPTLRTRIGERRPENSLPVFIYGGSMLRCYKSDKGFEEFYFLVETYAKFKNQHLFFDLRNEDPILIGAEIVALEELIKEHIEVGEL